MRSVLNKYVDQIPAEAVYIGRGSSFGNPYPIGPGASRDEVCDRFEEDLRNDRSLIEKVRRELSDVPVVCFCAQPNKHVRCHGDTLKGVTRMTETDLSAWRKGAFSLTSYDANAPHQNPDFRQQKSDSGLSGFELPAASTVPEQLGHPTARQTPAIDLLPVTALGTFDTSVREAQTFDPATAAAFFRSKDVNGRLSNMTNGMPITIDGKPWSGSEALYQALRFPDRPDIQEAIRRAPTGMAAKLVAKEHIAATRLDWDAVRVATMAWTITQKAQCSTAFVDALTATLGRHIVEQSSRDTFWGANRANYDSGPYVGRNMLGYLLDQKRDGATAEFAPRGSILLGKDVSETRSQRQPMPRRQAPHTDAPIDEAAAAYERRAAIRRGR